MHASKTRWIMLPAMALASQVLFDCGPVDTVDPTCSNATFNPQTGVLVSFGSSADARKVDAFLQATIDLNRAVNEVHDGLNTTCRAIGTDLGLAESAYVPMTAGEPAAATSCRRVAQEIQSVIQMALPRDARLIIRGNPPVCQVEVSLQASCAARCTVQVDAGVPQCMGTVVADCSGSCTGSCSGSCNAACSGECSGTCTGQCMGTCTGQCMGTCTQMDGQGRCVGQCSGMCMGHCSANCTGSCMGTCSAGCSGTCMGSCRGMCTVANNIRCDGQAYLNIETQCRAACEAQARARATCTEPSLVVTTTATVSPAALQRFNALTASLQRNFPRFQALAARAQFIGTEAAPNFVTSLNGVGQAATNTGLRAVSCMARAVVVTTEAATKFRASVDVSVQVSASVTVAGAAN